MKPNITTIPITELFTETEGCPICRMRRMLEAQYAEYITGDAMMSPDVRIQTNQKGFCHRHYSMMVNNGPRLSNALILQTHIDELRNKVFPKKNTDAPDKKMIAAIRTNAHTCYVCDRVDHDILHLLATVYVQFGADEEFRRQYRAQDFICLDDYALVTEHFNKKAMDRKAAQAFFEATNALSKEYMNTLYDDVTHFTTMFDYRNAGGDFKNSRDAIERSVRFLTSYPVDEALK